jgi:hypothetical protein
MVGLAMNALGLSVQIMLVALALLALVIYCGADSD